MLNKCICKNCRKLIGLFDAAGPFIHLHNFKVECTESTVAEPSIWMTEEEEKMLNEDSN